MVNKDLLLLFTQRKVIKLELYQHERQPTMGNEFTSMKSMTDWEKLESMTDEDIDFSDCPEITAEMAKNAVVKHGLKFSKKQSLTLFLDTEIVNWYKENEIKHQTEINHLLKEYIKHH